MPRKSKIPKKREFVIINSQLHYFCGFKHGAQFDWQDDYQKAKRFDDVAKFNWLQKNNNDEIIMDWVD